MRKGAHTRSKNPSIYWSKKFTSKSWLNFWPCVGDFFLSKNTLTQNIDGSNLFDIFDQSSIFWQLFNILTRVWAPVKILIKNSVLRWTFSQNQSYGNGSIRIKHFQHNEFWSKFWWNVCGQYGVKNLVKNWTSIFCFKILTVFLIVYGALKWRSFRTSKFTP